MRAVLIIAMAFLFIVPSAALAGAGLNYGKIEQKYVQQKPDGTNKPDATNKAGPKSGVSGGNATPKGGMRH
jgi:hypothetical protein